MTFHIVDFSDALYGFVTFDFIVMLLIVKILTFFLQPIIMIFPQFIIYMSIYNYLKLRTDPSITSQEIANYISVALAVALSVYCDFIAIK